MPQTKSAIKALRQTKRRTAHNKKVKKNLDYLFRQFKKNIGANDKIKAGEYTKKLIKTLDKAAKRNIIHKNKAAREKSKIMKKINNLEKNNSEK